MIRNSKSERPTPLASIQDVSNPNIEKKPLTPYEMYRKFGHKQGEKLLTEEQWKQSQIKNKEKNTTILKDATNRK